jgi:hypothetical protein
MYRYHDPTTVLSPKDCVSDVTPIFDGAVNNGAFSIAKVKWNGDPKIAVRWNVTEREWDDQNKINGSTVCVGEPNSRGYATWFILPNDLLKALLSGHGEIAEGVRKALEEIEQK